MDSASLPTLLTASKDAVKAFYPELETGWSAISEVAYAEEDAFRRTLAAGTTILDTAVADAKSRPGRPVLAGSVVRLVRSSMLDAMNADFIRTANMKGLGRTRIVLRHALKSALPPVVNLLAMQSASLFGGAVITESMFSIPGLGSLSLNALVSRDMPLLQGAILPQ